MTHTVEATAWTLIHFCWQAAVIAGAYRVASIVFARRTSQTRYVLALAALLAMLVAAVFTFAWQMRDAASPVVVAPPAASAGSLNAGDFPRVITSGLTAPSQSGARNLEFPTSLAGIMGWIDACWVIGVLVLALRGLGGWWLIHRLRVTATVQAPEAVRASFQRIADALGLRKEVLLRVSSAIAGPITLGAVRAVVLLPISAVTLLSPDEIEVVLAHELAHVRRADFFWNLVQTLVETLFFFHPAVWWISGCVRHERELCCDDLALKLCPNPVVYAKALFRLEEQRSRQMRLAMALDGHQPGQTLRMRIARILGEPTARFAGSRMRPFSVAAVFAALVVLLLPAPQVVADLHRTPASNLATVVTTKASSPFVVSPRPTTIAHVAAAAPRPMPQPEPAPAAEVIALASRVIAQTKDESAQAPAAESSGTTKGSYIDRMKAAGYDVDLDKLIAMKIQNVTPEYARAMAQVGFGKPSADDLISCKIHGVTPEVIEQFKKQGFQVESLHDAISYRIFNITPEYAESMKAVGFRDLDTKKLLSLRVQGVTPEYARSVEELGFGKPSVDDLIACKIHGVTAEAIAQFKQQGLEVKSLQDAISYRIFGVTPEFAEGMKAAGFKDLDSKKLVSLRVQGVTPEYAKSIAQQYPGATVDDVIKTRIFRIDADFIALAKQHGFTNLSLNKLVQLRISGLLDDESVKP